MRRVRLLVPALLLALCGGAAADNGHGPLLYGAVLSRVPGQNASKVAVRWNFMCLLDEYGSSTYDYRIVLRRLQPLPERRLPLTGGASRSGMHSVQLTPGRYRADADPFRCETGINLYSATPELGQPFTVPDYCAFSARLLDGVIRVSGRRLFADGKVRPGDTVVVPKRGSALLVDEVDAEVRAERGATVRLERATCATTAGWRWTLRSGSLTTTTPREPAAYEVAAGNAIVSGRAASWTTAIVGKRVTVKALRGTVSVQRGGKTQKVAAGRSLTL